MLLNCDASTLILMERLNARLNGLAAVFFTVAKSKGYCADLEFPIATFNILFGVLRP